MKVLMLCIATVVLFTGCESDLPPNPNQPSVSFGNNKHREDGNEHPAGFATDREQNVW